MKNESIANPRGSSTLKSSLPTRSQVHSSLVDLDALQFHPTVKFKDRYARVHSSLGNSSLLLQNPPSGSGSQILRYLDKFKKRSNSKENINIFKVEQIYSQKINRKETSPKPRVYKSRNRRNVTVDQVKKKRASRNR